MTKQEFFTYCRETFGTLPDYPFEEDFETAVMRHTATRKWYAIAMRVSRRKFGQASDEVIDVVNLKLPTEMFGSFGADAILYYPCNQWLYDQKERHYDVRMALEQRSYTKEILIAGVGLFTRAWGTTFEQDAPLSMPEYKRK